MKKLLFAILISAALLSCRAQTNISVIYSFLNGLNQNQRVVQVSFTPMSLGIYSNAVVVGDENYRVVSGNKLTNQMIAGFGYRVKYFRQKDPDVITAVFTNWFGTNVSGTVYASDYITISTNLGSGIYAYSQAQADARFAPIGSVQANAITNNQSGVTLAGTFSGTHVATAGYGNVPIVTNTPGGAYFSLYGTDGSLLFTSST